jgi:transcription initiation factor IIE alpha subunit
VNQPPITLFEYAAAMTLPPHSHVDTSEAAALAIAGKTEEQRQQIYALIVERGGLTSDEIQAITSLDGNSVRPRLWELEGNPLTSGRQRLIYKSDDKRLTRSNKLARVYKAVVS